MPDLTELQTIEDDAKAMFPSDNRQDIAPPPIEVKEQPIEDRLKYTKSGATQFHNELLSKLKRRRDMGADAIAQRTERWDDVDNFLRQRIDLDRKARLADGTFHTVKKEIPFERAIVVPHSFAMMHARLVQQMSMILKRNPTFPVSGASPEDVYPARLMSASVAYDCRKTNMPLVLNQVIWDAERYNMAITYDTWERDFGTVLKAPLGWGTPAYDIAKKTIGKFMPGLLDWKRDWGLRCEYTSVKPVDPRWLYPDPRVPLARAQEAEFIGHGTEQGLMYLIARSQENEGPYFNIDAVKMFCGNKGRMNKNRYTVIEASGYPTQAVDEHDKGKYAVDHMQIKLIPKDWKLAERDKPEIWWFTWVDDEVIIRCHPSPYQHDRFTYSIGESISDYHCLDNPGFGENMIGMQSLVDWLFASHVENTRRVLNASFIYAPSLIEESDLTNPVPAGHIRLTQKGEEMVMAGLMTPQNIVQQLQIGSPTVQHLNTISMINEMAMRMFAANDPVQGMQTPTERTLGEVKTILASASGRVAHSLYTIDLMAFKPLVERMIENRKQFTSQDQWYAMVGDLAQQAMEFVGKKQNIVNTPDGIRALVGREDLQGDYDYIPVTVTGADDPMKDPQAWATALQSIAQMQQAGAFDPQKYPDGRSPDLRSILNESLRVAGISNIDSLYIDDEQAKLQGLQAQFGIHQQKMQLMQQIQQFNEQAQQQGMPPFSPSVEIVPDEQYQRGMESGQYVTPEEMQ